MSCRRPPTLAEFAGHYHEHGGFIIPRRGREPDAEALARDYNSSLLGLYGGGKYDYETRKGRVAVRCPRNKTIWAVWTTLEIARAVVDPPVEQGALL